MTTRRRLIKGMAAAGGAALLAACTPTPTTGGPSPTATALRAKRGGTLTIGNQFDVGTVDPVISSGATNEYFHQHTIDRLLYAGRDLKLQPGLAEKWETSADEKSITLSLRKGVTYHDGTAFDAESVRWNFQRNMTHPKTIHTRALTPVRDVEVVDASTVRINLKSPNSPFVAQLTTALAAMVSRTEVEKLGDSFGTTPHKGGSGPYMFQEIVPNDHVSYIRNPNWWGRDASGGQLPYPDKLVIRIIPDASTRFTNVRTGTVDAIYDVSADDVVFAQSDPSFNADVVASTSWQEITFNHRAARPFNDSRLVKAVAMAVDRDELVRVVHKGKATVGYGTISPLHFAFDPSFKPYPAPDLDGARALVSAVGKGPLSFEMQHQAGDTVILQAAQLIQAQLKKAEINVTLKAQPVAQWTTDYTSGAFQDSSFAFNSGGGNVDPDVRFYDFRHSQGRSNYGKYVNADVDRLLDQQRAISDQAKRTDLLRQAQKICEFDQPCSVVLLFHPAYAVSVKAVQGWSAHPVIRPTFQNVWLNR